MTWQVGSWMFDPLSQPSLHNAGFLVLDVATIASPDQYETRIKSLIAEIHAAPTAAGIDRVLLPGEREWNLRNEAQQLGILLPEDVKTKLRTVAQETGIVATWL